MNPSMMDSKYKCKFLLRKPHSPLQSWYSIFFLLLNENVRIKKKPGERMVRGSVRMFADLLETSEIFLSNTNKGWGHSKYFYEWIEGY